MHICTHMCTHMHAHRVSLADVKRAAVKRQVSACWVGSPLQSGLDAVLMFICFPAEYEEAVREVVGSQKHPNSAEGFDLPAICKIV